MRGGTLQNISPIPRMIAIAGPKGGVGRSTCTAALGRALVIRERRTLLVEFCTLGSALGALLDVNKPEIQSMEHMNPVQTPLAGLDLLCLSAAQVRTDAQNKTSYGSLCEQLKQLGYDDIVLDLHAGFDELSYALFLAADFPILISDPEPECLQRTTQWLEQTIAAFVRTELPNLADAIDITWDFPKLFATLSIVQQTELLTTLAKFKCAFLLNHRREQSEHLQITALCHALGMMLGIQIRAFGSLSADDRRWFYARRMADVSLFTREDPLVRELEALLREHTPTFDHFVCLPTLDAKLQARDLLGVKTSGEARAAYRQLWEGYKRENGLVSAVMPRQMIAQTIQLLEIAHRNAELENTNLSENAASTSHHNYHSGGLPHTSDLGRHKTHTSGSLTRLGGKLSPQDCHQDAGLWLRQQRTDRGVTLSQLAMKTRIPQKLLESIENLTFEPIAAARLIAYLFEIARGLDLPADAVKHRFGI